MSNTELEYWGSEENFANHSHCDDELDPIYRHDYVVKLTKELASIREQLNSQKDRCIDLFEKVSEREEVIRELIPIAGMFVVHKEWMGEECKTEKAIIEKAKSLTTKNSL